MWFLFFELLLYFFWFLWFGGAKTTTVISFIVRALIFLVRRWGEFGTRSFCERCVWAHRCTSGRRLVGFLILVTTALVCFRSLSRSCIDSLVACRYHLTKNPGVLKPDSIPPTRGVHCGLGLMWSLKSSSWQRWFLLTELDPAGRYLLLNPVRSRSCQCFGLKSSGSATFSSLSTWKRHSCFIYATCRAQLQMWSYSNINSAAMNLNVFIRWLRFF